MGYLKELIKRYRESRRELKSKPQEDIENYIETEKMRNRIEFIKKWERNEFLYGEPKT